MSGVSYYTKNKFEDLLTEYVQLGLIKVEAVPALMLTLYPYVNYKIGEVLEEKLSHIDVATIEAERIMQDWDLDDVVAVYSLTLEEKTGKDVEAWTKEILDEIVQTIHQGQVQTMQIIEQAANMPEETREVWLQNEFEKLMSI